MEKEEIEERKIEVKTEDRARFQRSSFDVHEVTSIIGKKGTGKSVFTDKLLTYYSKKRLVILLDTKREYNHIPLATFEILTAKDEKTGKYLVDRGVYRVFEIEYEGFLIRDLYKIVEWLSSLMFERGKCILAVEELANCSLKHGRLYDCNPELAVLIQQGRSREIGFIGTTQRPQEVHTTILSESDHIVCFNLTSPHDHKAMRSYIYPPEKFEKLNRHEFFHLNLKGNYLRHCYKLRLSSQELAKYKRFFGRS